MISEFDRHEEHVANDLVQFLVDRDVLAQFVTHFVSLRPLEVPSKACVEDLAQDVLRLTIHGDWLAQSACNYLAEQVVLQSVVQEY